MAMKKRAKEHLTAAELLAELEKDPTYRARQEHEEADRRARDEQFRVIEASLIDDLKEVGVKVESVWDLVNTRATYAPAIRTLLEHFHRDYPPEVREGIARALAVPEASWAWDVLLDAFIREPVGGPRNVKWALACALSGASTEPVIPRIIDLVRDESTGENRLALLSALARSSNPEARETLEQLREHPQLKREIRLLIGRPKRK